MIQISDSAQRYFRRLIERESVPGMGVRLQAIEPGTPQADARLEFAEPADLVGDEWAIDCDGFTVYVAATATAPNSSWRLGSTATDGQLKVPTLPG